MQDGWLEVGGQRVHYVEAGTGKPAVLIHGFAPFSTWRVWEANIGALVAHRRVIALELPGYGDSPPAGGAPTEIQQFFQGYIPVVRGFLEALDAGPVALVGLSAGGGVALHVTAERPELVEKLVLVDSAGASRADDWKVITAPTLIVWQREDQLLPLAQGEALQRAIPGARLEVLEGNAAGIEPYQWHWPQALNPQRFNDLVTEFLAS